MKLQYLGTAAAEGAPALFCRCEFCQYARKAGGREIRTRSGALLDDKIKLDFGPDSYKHMLDNGLDYSAIHSVLITHTHEDHFDIEDIALRRPTFAHLPEGEPPMTFYGNERVGERLAIIGNEAALGDWDGTRALPMVEHNFNEWVITLDASKFKNPIIEFKFAIIDKPGDASPMWETGDNRRVVPTAMRAGDVVVYELNQAYFPVYPVKLAGTVVPIFSLRSDKSFGVGDFGDLKRMIDWVASTGQRALQVLPINDSTITHTWTDSYPYNSISIYALHPQYMDLNQLPPLADKKRAAQFEVLRQELNALPQIDYERVNNAKHEYLHLIFEQE